MTGSTASAPRVTDLERTPERGLHFERVSKVFPARGSTPPLLAVRDVELTVPAGRFVCLIGPSGSGKSTLLNMAAGLFPPTHGRVHYDGAPVRGVNTRTGYITQQDNLLPWRTLVQNVEIALEIRGVARRERRDRARGILDRVGLTGFEQHFPSQLSGGMRKRATLARTLIYEPATLLMDEPFGALDAMLRRAMQQDLLDLWERDRRTVLFVTHDLEEAIVLADEVVVFGRNPGRIIHTEPISFDRPRGLKEIRRTPEFTAVWDRLWSLIEGEMHSATEGAGAMR